MRRETRTKRDARECPLQGVKVLDFTQYVSGPFCTMLLAELGADVVKVEPPDGDVYRRQGPTFIGGVATSFLSVNRGKRSLRLDLKRRDSRTIVKGLARWADVVIENFRPGTAARLGIGYASLRRIKPGLIYCSISGYGAASSESTASRGGYDLMAQARGGLMSLTGWPSGPPTKMGVPVVDLCTGLYAAVGILSALRVRDCSGTGTYLDVSLLDTAVSLLPMALAEYEATGQVPTRMGNASPFFAPYDVFRTSDGWIAVVGTGGKDHWEAFCHALDQPQLAVDPRFKTNADRVRRRLELTRVVGGLLQSRPTAFWIERFGEADVPCERVQDLAEVVDDPVVRSRQLLGRCMLPDGQSVLTPLFPVRCAAPQERARLVPGLGQHTEEVLREVGFTRQEIALFQKSKTI